jgi:hypothetical protein
MLYDPHRRRLVAASVASALIVAVVLAVALVGGSSASSAQKTSAHPARSAAVDPSQVSVSEQDGGTPGCQLNPDSQDPSDATQHCYWVKLPDGVSPDDPNANAIVQQKLCKLMKPDNAADTSAYNMEGCPAVNGTSK